MGSDDRRNDGQNNGWNEAAPQGSRPGDGKLVRAAKLPADCLVGSADERTATELMNELQASGGTNNKVLSELQCRLGGLVMNELWRAGLRREAVNEAFADVWKRVWEISQKPAGLEGAWNPGNARHTSDPFVPWLKRVAYSAAMNVHRTTGRQRKRQAKLKEFVEQHGEAWVEQRGDWKDDEQPGMSQQRQAKRATSAGATEERRSKDLPTVTRREAARAQEKVLETVAELDERQRVVLELNADGRKNVEIGAIVGCSKGEASRRLTAARKTAIERLTGHGEATVCQK